MNTDTNAATTATQEIEPGDPFIAPDPDLKSERVQEESAAPTEPLVEAG
jgi:hypothetical protein